MPVRLSPRHRDDDEARIEIIPLIDIMFFLLAAFMLVSLKMVHLNSTKVNLPVSSSAAPDPAKDEPIVVCVDKAGVISLDKTPLTPSELSARLKPRAASGKCRVLIAGDAESRHRDLMRALDAVRDAGVSSVAFVTQKD
jgi:biopolymer transport protein ExbD